ncbi:MAG: shikimate kinase [Eubacteriales bacterium]|nr:shikimate kinase [Eubacteriales bacterium]
MILTMDEFRAYQPTRTTFALFGHPIAHTMSPELHASLFSISGQGCDYFAVDVPPEQLGEAMELAAQKCSGLNLTIPHKKAVFDHLDAVDETARDLGSVNTVLFSGGEAIGYNTDILGFAGSLEFDHINPQGKLAVVCGYGGVSRVMGYHLAAAGARLILTGRNLAKAKALRNELRTLLPDKSIEIMPSTQLPRATEIVVNGTPLGMYPHEDGCPLEKLPQNTKYIFDAVYNPPCTAIMKLGGRDVTTRNGLLMLVLQAAYAQTIWLGTQFNNNSLNGVLRRLSGDMAKKRLHDVYGKSNIVLCGFMGSGKTTIGRKLARALNCDFLDADQYLEEREGKTISTIFDEVGETGFRDIETDCARELAEKDGCVIALGGGAVLRPENVALYKKNGILIHLNTPFYRIVQNLSRDTTRPLLQGDKENQTRILYQKRKPIYAAAADRSVTGTRISELVDAVFAAI